MLSKAEPMQPADAHAVPALEGLPREHLLAAGDLAVAFLTIDAPPVMVFASHGCHPKKPLAKEDVLNERGNNESDDYSSQ